MRAIVRDSYGPPDVLRLEETPTPAPRDDEVLVKVYAAALNAADRHILRGDPFLVRMMIGGLRKPKHRLLGADVAGHVEAVGGRVTRFKPGDEVFGDLSGCGWGAFAEYVCAREEALALKPSGSTFEQAAATPLAAVTALQGLRNIGQLQPGQTVLVHGAGGGVGTFAVQIAKALGAEVTAVCSTAKLELARAIGADHVVDYTREDFTQAGRHYDVILDTGAYHPLSYYKPALSARGIYVIVGGAMRRIFQTMLLGRWMSQAGGKKLTFLSAKPNSQDLAAVGALMEAGKVVPVVDRRYPLDQLPEAMRYLEAGSARGKVVITVAG